ncbi:MAG: hypothetical protein P8074_17545 [Anaerolineales bacterium]|jgi:hypothetical protein
MDIFFQDPTEVPLPPEEVRIREFHAEAWPDGRRVRVYLEVDPFQKRPNADILITDEQDRKLASASIIESMDRKMEITMHLRGEVTSGEHHATAVLFYSQMAGEDAAQDQPDSPQAEREQPPEPKIQVVDRAETQFSIIED